MVRWKTLIDYYCPSDHVLDRLKAFRAISFVECRNDTRIPEPARLGVNDFLYKRLCDTFGLEKARSICRTLNESAPTTIRVNLIKTTRDDLLKLWEGKFEMAPCARAAAGIHFAKRTPLSLSPNLKPASSKSKTKGASS